MKPFARITLVSSLALAAAGCSMKEFSSTPFYTGDEVKFTGAVEDRVNMWPVAYWREPVGSVAWPLVSWGDDHFALRPLYSRYKQGGKRRYDEYNILWPFCQFNTVYPACNYDTNHYDCRVSLFGWGEDMAGEPYFYLFPVLAWNKDVAGVFPLFWLRGDSSGFCGFPLYWHIGAVRGDAVDTLFPLYFYAADFDGDSLFWALWGLAGYGSDDGESTSNWFLPFYEWNRGDFYSLPYSRYKDDGLVKTRILAGLAGCNATTNGGYAASWMFPLYYLDENRLVTPLFGKSGDAMWVCPLWYVDEDTFATPLYGRSGDADWFFPLFYRDSEKFVSPLFGKSGETHWFLPFYISDEDSFFSIPYGYDEECGRKTTCFALGLAGIRSGDKDDMWLFDEGWWFFPLYSKRRSVDFAEKLALLDADRLPDSITITDNVFTNAERHCGIVHKNIYHRLGAPFLDSHDLRTHFLLSDNDHWVSGHLVHTDYFPDEGEKPQGRYAMDSRREIGNRIVFRHESRRAVEFDAMTREKTKDEETAESSLLFFLYNHERRANRLDGTSYTSHRVLWKLWDWEEENGDVSLDAFPCFTYDSKKNGYVKTSLLWRLFRYERNPKTDETAVDLLFIPVWR